MADSTQFSIKAVQHTAKLANLTLTDEQQQKFAVQFSQTLQNIDSLKQVDTKGVALTHHVTGLENVLRQDKVDPDRALTQDEALSSTKHTHKGYFVVNAVIDNE